MHDKEFEVLKKYRSGAIVEEKDEYIVERFQSTGIMKSGFTEKQETDNLEAKAEIVPTAGLTEFGKKLYRREYIRRTPILRFLHGVVHSV